MAAGQTTAQIILQGDDRTKAAFASVGKSFTSAGAQAAALTAKLSAVAATVGTVVAAFGVKQRIDFLDQLDDLSEKTGVTVEKLSELRFAGEATGTPLEALATGLGKLSKSMAAAAGGNKEAASTFAALGVSVKNADGTLRGSDQVLGDLADRFASYEDGADKAALAQRVFGKSGAEMIPLLNQGKDGIASLRREAEQLGAIYSGELAKDAATFNDNLAKLKIASEAAAIKLAGPLITSLKDVSAYFLEATKEGGRFNALLITIGAGIARAIGADEIGQAKSRAKDATEEMQRLAGIMQGVELTLQRDPQNEMALRRLATLRQQISVQQKAAQAASEDLKRLANEASPLDKPKTDEKKPKARAPIIADGSASAEADQLAKKALEDELKTIRQGAENRKLALEFANAQAQDLYRDGLSSLQTYLQQQADARAKALAIETEQLDKEKAALEKYQRAVSNPVEQADAANKIRENSGKRSQAIVKAAQVEQLAIADNARAVEQLKDKYDDLQASILQMSGNALGAAQLRLEQQVRDAGRLATQAGQDPIAARAALRQQLEGQAQLNDLQTRYGRIVQSTSVAEENARLDAEARGAGEIETLRVTGEARQKSLGQLKAMADEARKIAEHLNTDDARAYADELALAFKRAVAEADPLLKHLQDVGKSASDVIAGGLEKMALEGQGFSATLKDIDKQLAQIALNELFTKPLKNQLSNLLGGNGQASGGGGLLGSLFGGVGAAASNRSSVTGDASTDRLTGLAGKAGSSWFSGIGDWFKGLSSFDVGTDYVPEDMIAKVHKGERIVPAAQNKPGAGRASNVTLVQNFTLQGAPNRQTQQQLAASGYAGVQRAARRGS